MRIARVKGYLTMSRKLEALRPGRWLICDTFDAAALAGCDREAPRAKPMPEALVVYDELGAGVGQVIAVSEGREAAQPFWPQRVPIDAYCAAILDRVEVTVKAI